MQRAASAMGIALEPVCGRMPVLGLSAGGAAGGAVVGVLASGPMVLSGVTDVRTHAWLSLGSPPTVIAASLTAVNAAAVGSGHSGGGGHVPSGQSTSSGESIFTMLTTELGAVASARA